jgi:hypothetical protein
MDGGGARRVRGDHQGEAMKIKKRDRERKRITFLKMADGSIVRDPKEIVRLLRANGFTVDDDGRLGLTEGLKRPQ